MLGFNLDNSPRAWFVSPAQANSVVAFKLGFGWGNSFPLS